MKIEGANETDVREEIASPFLAVLGYKRGTCNDIARELVLTYERQFLGTKKPTDPPLRGRADYVLTVIGAGRWVLETKAPNEPIDGDAIEQAMTYARHPEVSASYSVVLNGVRLTVADQLGHSVDVNLNVYSKTALGLRKEAVDALERLLEQSNTVGSASRIM